MAEKNEVVLTIVDGSGVAKESGRAYNFIDVLIGDTQITRLFPKDTEKLYFQSLLGSYKKINE